MSENSDILASCKPEPTREFYIVGGLSWRINMHTQQKRAILLANALADRLKEAREIAIIGGGAAGITCAATLLLRGKKVTLFEKFDHLLPLQKKNSTRFIHPNTVTWPKTDLLPWTDLPYLNWHAGLSRNVAALIESEFRKDFVGDDSGVRLELGTKIVSIEKVSAPGGSSARRERLGFVGACQTDEVSRDFDAVLIATGFGEEGKISGYDRFSYWEDTSPLPIGARGDGLRVAVIGSGDGALLEIFRVAWGEELLEGIYEFIEKGTCFSDAEALIAQIIRDEDTATQMVDRGSAQGHDVLKALYEPDPFTDEGSAWLRDRLRRTAERLILVTRARTPYGPGASPVHKLLLAFLFREGQVHVEYLEAKSVRCARKLYSVSGLWEGEKKRLGRLNRVIERLGPAGQFSGLVVDAFGDDKGLLERFLPVHSAKLHVFNPSGPRQFGPGGPHKGIAGPCARREPVEVALDKAKQFFRQSLPEVPITLAIGSERDQATLVVTYPAGEDRIARDGPTAYLGFELEYREARAEPFVSIATTAASPLAVLKAKGHGGKLRLGSAICNATHAGAPGVGHATVFVRSIEQAGRGTSGDTYLLTAANALAAEQGDSIAMLEGGAGSEIGTVDADRFSALRPAGELDWRHRFAHTVLAIKVNADVEPLNRVGKHSVVGLRSSLEHLFLRDAVLHLDGTPFGTIQQVRAHLPVINHAGRALQTSGFIVSLTEKVAADAHMLLGKPLLTSEHRLVGMLIAVSPRQAFCLDLEEVLATMQCVLI